MAYNYVKKDPFINKSNQSVSVYGKLFPSKSEAIRTTIMDMSNGLHDDITLADLTRMTDVARQLVYACYDKMLKAGEITDFKNLKSRKGKANHDS